MAHGSQKKPLGRVGSALRLGLVLECGQRYRVGRRYVRVSFRVGSALQSCLALRYATFTRSLR